MPRPGNRLFALCVAALVVALLRAAFTPGELPGYRFDTELRFGIFFTLVGALVLIWGARLRPTQDDRLRGRKLLRR